MRFLRDRFGSMLHFKNGLQLGFRWHHGGDGRSSKTTALLATYHHPDSITWRWVLVWSKPSRKAWLPSVDYRQISMPILGTLTWETQDHMFRV